MNKNINKFILIPLINLIIGILIIIFKGEVIRWCAIAFGVLLTAQGIISLVSDAKKKSNQNNIITFDILMIVFGVLLIVFAGFVTTVIRVLFGIVFILYGVLKLMAISNDKDNKSALLFVFESVLLIIIGVLVFMDNKIIYIFIGALLIIDSIIGFINYFNKNKNEKKKDVIDAEIKVINEEVSK